MLEPVFLSDPQSQRFPVRCCFHAAIRTSGRALLLLKRMFLHMALPQTPGNTCSPGKASPNTGWPWKAKCHFKFANASCHRFWARQKPWSEPSLGLGETKFKHRIKSGTSSPSHVILLLPARCWLAHLGTSCRWVSVLRNIRQHLRFFCNCSRVYYCQIPYALQRRAVRHSPALWQPPPAGRQPAPQG